MEQKKPENNWKWWVGVILFFIVVFWLIWLSGSSSWQDEGEINIFPENAESKNYRLPASISAELTRSFPFNEKIEYTIESFTWPDAEEETYFDNNCIVIDRETTECEYKSKVYRVEIETPPEQPEGVSESDEGYAY